jgi:hypothetical protein
MSYVIAKRSDDETFYFERHLGTVVDVDGVSLDCGSLYNSEIEDAAVFADVADFPTKCLIL